MYSKHHNTTGIITYCATIAGVCSQNCILGAMKKEEEWFLSSKPLCLQLHIMHTCRQNKFLHVSGGNQG